MQNIVNEENKKFLSTSLAIDVRNHFIKHGRFAVVKILKYTTKNLWSQFSKNAKNLMLKSRKLHRLLSFDSVY